MKVDHTLHKICNIYLGKRKSPGLYIRHQYLSDAPSEYTAWFTCTILLFTRPQLEYLQPTQSRIASEMHTHSTFWQVLHVLERVKSHQNSSKRQLLPCINPDFDRGILKIRDFVISYFFGFFNRIFPGSPRWVSLSSSSRPPAHSPSALPLSDVNRW